MTPSIPQSFGKCSFLTQMILLGWGPDNRPIWGKLQQYDERKRPGWADWQDSQRKFIIPFCKLAKLITLFGVEWQSDELEVIELKKFVDTHFKKEGRYLQCNHPEELTDAMLFWTGGGPNYFNLITVLSFDISNLTAILHSLSQHTQAGTMSPRYGGEYTRINNFSKSVVKTGNFAVIFDGQEAEIFYPIEFEHQIKEAANEVEARRLKEAKYVKSRIEGSTQGS